MNPFSEYFIFDFATPEQVARAYILAARAPRKPMTTPRRVVIEWAHKLGELMEVEDEAKRLKHLNNCDRPFCPFCITDF